jgi:hypothetical protein
LGVTSRRVSFDITTGFGSNPLLGHQIIIASMKNLNDPESRAPRDNDNARGIAAILETSRILYDVNLEDSVQFVFFPDEEQGFIRNQNITLNISKIIA